MLFDPIFLDFPSIFYLWRGGMLRKIYFFRSIKGKQTGREEKERMVENRRRKEEMGARGEAWKRRRLLEKITVRFRHLVNLWPWVRSCVRSLDRSWLKPLANLYHVSTSYRREKASNHQPSLPQNLTRLPSLSISISSPLFPLHTQPTFTRFPKHLSTNWLETRFLNEALFLPHIIRIFQFQRNWFDWIVLIPWISLWKCFEIESMRLWIRLIEVRLG